MRTLILFAVAIAVPAFAEDRPLLGVPGNLVYAESFSTFPSGWTVSNGKWAPADGVLLGAEVAEDEHAAGFRMSREMQDFIIQYEVKLDGAKGTSLSINDAGGHLARVSVSPAYVSVSKDDHDKEGPDASVSFGSRGGTIAPGTWHKVRLEIVGNEMLGKVDDFVAYGKHDQLSAPKANLSLTVSGQSASFRDFKVWEATPNPDWKKVQSKIAKPETSKPPRRGRRK